MSSLNLNVSWKNFVSCIYINESGQYRWNKNVKNSDVFNILQAFRGSSLGKPYDMRSVLEFLSEIEGIYTKHIRTFERELKKFINNCSSLPNFPELFYNGIINPTNFHIYGEYEKNLKLKRQIGIQIKCIERLRYRNKILKKKNLELETKRVSFNSEELIVYQMIEKTISYGKISEIFELFGKHISERTIYRYKDQFLYLTEVATALQLQEFLENGEGFTLHHDETTTGVNKIQGFILSGWKDYQMTEIVVAIEKVPTKSSTYQLHVLVGALQRIDTILNANGKFLKMFILKLESCMADRAATSNAFNNELNRYRKELCATGENLTELNLKECFVHSANNISKDVVAEFDKVHLEFSKKIKELATMLNFKNAAFHPIAADFKNFQIKQNFKTPKSLNDVIGHRFMFLNDIAFQILELRSIILEYIQQCKQIYMKEAAIIEVYLNDPDFISHLKLCVVIHAVCIEPIKNVSTSSLVELSAQQNFRSTLYEVYDSMENANFTNILEIVPDHFHFIFNKNKLKYANEIQSNESYLKVMTIAKQSADERYFSRSISDNDYSYYNNINLERIFAMTKRNEDMAPNKEIYTRMQQIKARCNGSMQYLKSKGKFKSCIINRAELKKNTEWIKECYRENLKWNAEERMKRLVDLETKAVLKQQRIQSKTCATTTLNRTDILSTEELMEILTEIVNKTDRIKLLKHQLALLRHQGLKFGKERPWINKKIDLEASLKLKIVSLHSIDV